MLLNKKEIKQIYERNKKNITAYKTKYATPLTLTEKILIAHAENIPKDSPKRDKDYLTYFPDRVAMQDATAQMALLQFIQTGSPKAAVAASVHCDHLIIAENGAEKDLKNAKIINQEVYDFLRSTAAKYQIGFWEPGSGIIHQIVLENYALPGTMIIGTDSHTPTAGGVGCLGIGVGGADAVDVLSGLSWELKMPEIIGVKLTGSLSGWTRPKDIILNLLGQLSVKGGTGSVIEYFGEGTASISATGKATICNMGAELGATSSVFPYDITIKDYINRTGRQELSGLLQTYEELFTPDSDVTNRPESFYNQVIEINLNQLKPHLNGPYSPDKAFTVEKSSEIIKEKQYPHEVKDVLIGSCTNSSFEDLNSVYSILKQATDHNIKPKATIYISPGSKMIAETIKSENMTDLFKKTGAVVLANACGPCIGQWKRPGADKLGPNTIVHSFNRNFSKRADGNPETRAFVASAETAAVIALAGRLDFNPEKDVLISETGEKIKLTAPVPDIYPSEGFQFSKNQDDFIKPSDKNQNIHIQVNPESERIELLKPFEPWDGKNLKDGLLLIKVKGKCTTDHISPAGVWLKYRGHLSRISDNLLSGAVNAFTEKQNEVKNQISKKIVSPAESARIYQKENIFSVIVGDENYGEGSSREHAAMEPRHLGVKVVIARSYARIHETNLKKQGIFPFTFKNKKDYEKIQEDDRFDFMNLSEIGPGKDVLLKIHHKGNGAETIPLKHTLNDLQMMWIRAGSSLNDIRHSVNQ